MYIYPDYMYVFADALLTVLFRNSQRAHAEHEKDFVYRYLPFILANALFFSFYFLW